MSTGKAAAAGVGRVGRTIKQKVQSNRDAPHATRFFNTLWTYRTGQLTTSNIRRLRETGIPLEYASSGGSSSSSGGTSGSENESTPVKSDLQPHALHKFTGDDNWSLVVAVPKNSDHFRNVVECSRGSLMVGHTDPQLFHWFKQLGTLPPRSIVSGSLELLTGDLEQEAWEQTFSRHPVIHNIAQEMWTRKESKTEEECVTIERREREEDEKRMRRMSSSDWRAKFKERERNPTAEEDEERPIYVIKPETFALLRLRPEVKLWMNFVSQTQRVWEPLIPDPDPLCRCSPRFIRMLNLARQKLVPSLNMNYSLKLTNAFVFEIDQKGIWAMGTQENLDTNTAAAVPSSDDGSGGGGSTVREEWTELRLEFGKGQEIRTEQEMEWWVRGLTKLGAPEVSQSNSSVEDAGMNPEDYDYRHI
ncbi:uncharacterized protein TM35_000381170 [Trypanosoma theileri]|uniref:Uncharacterized protein n=1 Tax=Trypanosoma theileri TaxID=67003 RepID=A0A1X0NJW6_9TRYP|nr:uncharacterized protein TM35_000381170 [Trypanosoma theileri]ORC85042.1 hypothetical protein TM35_000381170 [Trypanosoma theileri]